MNEPSPETRSRPVPLRRALATQGLPYLLVGGVQLGLDWGMFVLLSWLGLPVPVANVAGRIAGACLGFWLNGIYTFRADGNGPLARRHALKFAVSWLFVTVLSTLAVTALSHVHGLGSGAVRLEWIGKPVVDAFLAGVGFLLSKYWIYR